MSNDVTRFQIHQRECEHCQRHPHAPCPIGRPFLNLAPPMPGRQGPPSREGLCNKPFEDHPYILCDREGGHQGRCGSAMTIKEMCDLNHRHYSERQAVVAAWFRPIYATHKNRRDAELEAAGVGRASGYAARASALLDETPARRTHPAEYRFSDRMELVFRRQKEEQDINWSYYRYVEAHIRAGCFSLDAPRKGRMKVLMSMLSPGFDKPPDYGDLDVCPHHDEPRPEEAPAFLHRRYRKAAPETHNAQEAV